MERMIINPWTWQDQMGYVQANEVQGAGRTIYCAGQGSVDDEGRTVHPDDMGAQLSQAVDNLEAVFGGAGASLSDVARLNIYTTDVDRFFEAYGSMAGVSRRQAAGPRARSWEQGASPSSTTGFLSVVSDSPCLAGLGGICVTERIYNPFTRIHTFLRTRPRPRAISSTVPARLLHGFHQILDKAARTPLRPVV